MVGRIPPNLKASCTLKEEFMDTKLLALCFYTAGAIQASQNSAMKSGPSAPFPWRLTDEASCVIETVDPVQTRTTLHLTIEKVAGAKEIRVQNEEQDQPLGTWINSGPYDTRSITITPARRIQIKIDVPTKQKHPPHLKITSLDPGVLTCGKTRLKIQTL